MTISTFSDISQNEVESTLIEMEKTALARWCNGDPSGFLEINAKDVVYFDPFIEKRLDGFNELSNLYESLRGKIFADKFEMVNPKVQLGKDIAVLTFNFNSWDNNKEFRWNATEIYQLQLDNSWKIIHSHWSLTKPELKQ